MTPNDPADATDLIPPAKPAPRARPRKVAQFRPWVQTAFLAVWLLPQSWGLNALPGCVFHCYACPLSTFACPVGVAANFAALGVFPLLAVGILLTAGALVGSLICGWACPFGFLQDLLAKIPVPKFRIPDWMGWGRYAVLIVLVLAVPYVLGWYGVDFEHQAVNICRVCPAGALEGGVPNMAREGLAGNPIPWMSWWKFAILGAFLVGSVITFRPWCMILCPLGGFLSLFNRFSLLHLHFRRNECVQCNTCRARCRYGVKVDLSVNRTRCIRCLECTNCGAISPAIGLPKAPKAEAKKA